MGRFRFHSLSPRMVLTMKNYVLLQKNIRRHIVMLVSVPQSPPNLLLYHLLHHQLIFLLMYLLVFLPILIHLLMYLTNKEPEGTYVLNMQLEYYMYQLNVFIFNTLYDNQMII